MQKQACILFVQNKQAEMACLEIKQGEDTIIQNETDRYLMIQVLLYSTFN